MTVTAYGQPVHGAESVAVRLRDGTRLHTDVYLPRSARRVPAILIRTPYDKTHPDTLLPELAVRLVDAGFAVVLQDVRGKIRSTGRAVPFADEAADAHQVLDWLTAQPWSDGVVGCWGNSYYGYTAWAACASGHPAVRALVSRLTTTDVGGQLVHRNGVFRLGPMVEWLLSTWAGTSNRLPRIDWSRRPLADLLAALPGTGSTLPARDWPATPPADPRWRRLTFDGRDPVLGRLPTLHWAGWYDLFTGGQLADWRHARRAARAPQYLIASASDHLDNVFTVDGVRSADRPDIDRADPLVRQAILDRTVPPVVDFFARYLRADAPSGGRRIAAPVRWQAAGDPADDGWRADEHWPPTGVDHLRLHLVGGSQDGGDLSCRPDHDAHPVHWEHDPRDLVPATDVDWWRPLPALPDEREVENRADVVTFTGPAVRRALHLAGPVLLTAVLRSTAPVHHVVVKLCDVAPDGVSRRILEAPYRIEDADHPRRVRIPLGDTAYRLGTGHRLRLQLASSCFPLYLPHSGDQRDPWTAERLAGSGQEITVGGQHGAHLDLAVACPGT